MLDARLDNLSRKPLGDLRGFGDGVPIGDQARNIRAGGKKTAIVQRLDMEPNRRPVHVSAPALDPARVASHAHRKRMTGRSYRQSCLELRR